MGSEVDELKTQLADALKQLAAATAALEVPQEEETAPTPAKEAEKKEAPKPKPAPPPPPPAPKVKEPAPIVFTEGFMRTPKFGKVDLREQEPYPSIYVKGQKVDHDAPTWPTGREALEQWEDWGAMAGIQGPCRHLNPLPSKEGKLWNENGAPHIKSQFWMYNLEKQSIYPNKAKADKYLQKFMLPKEATAPIAEAFKTKNVVAFREALSGLDRFLKEKPEWTKVRVLERDLPKILKPLMTGQEDAAYDFFKECFDETFMTEAWQTTLTALFSEPIDMRGDYTEETYSIALPTNTPGVLQSVLQQNSADDGWEMQKVLSWCPYSVMFASHCSATQPEARYGNYYPFGRDPGDEPAPNMDWVEGINYTHPDMFDQNSNAILS